MLQKVAVLFCSFSFLTYLCRRKYKPKKTDDIEQKLLLLLEFKKLFNQG